MDMVKIKGWTFEIKDVKSVTTYPNENDIYIEFLDENNQYHYIKARIDHAVVTYQGHEYGHTNN